MRESKRSAYTRTEQDTATVITSLCVDHSPTGWEIFFFVWDCVNESVYICDPKKEKDRKQREKGVNEQKGCSESSDPNRKHSDESPDNGFSVELLEPAAADPQHTAPQATHETAAPHYSYRGGGPSSGRNGEKRQHDQQQDWRKSWQLTKYQTTFLMMIKAGIQNHILSD